MENDKLLAIGETAKLLGVSVQTLRRWDDKGILKSFRATIGGNRFYKERDISIFSNDLPTIGWKWASQTSPTEPEKNFYCRTKDVFAPGRLARLENDLQKIETLGIHHSLLSSMVEKSVTILMHNLGNWIDIQGMFSHTI